MKYSPMWLSIQRTTCTNTSSIKLIGVSQNQQMLGNQATSELNLCLAENIDISKSPPGLADQWPNAKTRCSSHVAPVTLPGPRHGFSPCHKSPDQDTTSKLGIVTYIYIYFLSNISRPHLLHEINTAQRDICQVHTNETSLC